MNTRSGKTTRRERPASEEGSLNSSPKRIRRITSEADLEQELAHPSKQDYNLVRNALIAARAESRLKKHELEAKKRELEDRDRELKKQVQQPSSFRVRGSLETVPRENLEREGQDAPSPGGAMLKRLRSDIRNFSIKYFGDELRQPIYVDIEPGWPSKLMQATTPGEDTFADYLLSRRRCPLVIQAFIWRYLTGIIFNGALWSDNEKIRKHVGGLQRTLSRFYSPQHSDPERVKRYQQWKQATTNLVLELHTVPSKDPRFDTVARRHAAAISKVITPFMRTSHEGNDDGLVEIINQAIELDREISKQLPLITWAFRPGLAETTFEFSPDQGNIMQLNQGERTRARLVEGTHSKVYLVVAPGLTQRGEENNQWTSFDDEVWMEKMQVSCVRPRPQETFAER